MINGKWRLTGLSMKNGLIKTIFIEVYTKEKLNILYYFQDNFIRIISTSFSNN
jgi:hypothetical protein